MYSKIIKRGKKQYKYYYHNFKENGNVRNVLLGSDIKEAQNKLKEIQEKRSSEIKLLAPPSPLYPPIPFPATVEIWPSRVILHNR